MGDVLESILSDGTGFWSPLIFIGATVERGLQDLQGIEGTVPFELTGVVLGLIGHMTNSMVFGVMFAFVFASLTGAECAKHAS